MVDDVSGFFSNQKNGEIQGPLIKRPSGKCRDYKSSTLYKTWILEAALSVHANCTLLTKQILVFPMYTAQCAVQ